MQEQKITVNVRREKWETVRHQETIYFLARLKAIFILHDKGIETKNLDFTIVRMSPKKGFTSVTFKVTEKEKIDEPDI